MRALLSLLAPVALLACPMLDAAMPLANIRSLSDDDVARMSAPRPAASSHVHGTSPADAYEKMNAWLRNVGVRTRACADLRSYELDATARALHAIRIAALDDHYKRHGDRRALHFSTIDYKEALWAAEAQLPAGTPSYNATRDGKCLEVVMWFVHHLSQAQRTALGALESFVLPLMPSDVAPKEHRSAEYELQASCDTCHVAKSAIDHPPQPSDPDQTANSTDPPYPPWGGVERAFTVRINMTNVADAPKLRI